MCDERVLGCEGDGNAGVGDGGGVLGMRMWVVQVLCLTGLL